MTKPAAPAARDLPPDPRPLHLVFGASGYIGSNLVPELLRGGHRVRATARNVEVLEGRGWAGAGLAQADALDPATLPAALAGVDVAYYLVHSMAAGRDFGAIDRRAAETLRPGRGLRGRAPHRVPRWPDPAEPAFRAPEIASRDRRRAAHRAGAGHRGARRNDHRPGLRGLRGDPRPGESLAGDDHPGLGSLAIDAHRAARPACLPDRRGRAG